MSDAKILSQSDRHQIGATLKPDALTLTLQGLINEDFNPDAVLQAIDAMSPKPKIVRLDTLTVERFNSVGLRAWAIFIRDLESKYNVVFSIVGEALIEQADIFPAVFGRKKIVAEHFVAPYLCGGCGQRFFMKLKPTDVNPLLPALDQRHPGCPKCSTPADFDTDEETLIAFLRKL